MLELESNLAGRCDVTERAKLRWIRSEPRESGGDSSGQPRPGACLGPCQHFFVALNIIIMAAPTSCLVPLVRKARLGLQSRRAQHSLGRLVLRLCDVMSDGLIISRVCSSSHTVHTVFRSIHKHSSIQNSLNRRRDCCVNDNPEVNVPKHPEDVLCELRAVTPEGRGPEQAGLAPPGPAHSVIAPSFCGNG